MGVIYPDIITRKNLFRDPRPSHINIIISEIQTYFTQKAITILTWSGHRSGGFSLVLDNYIYK